MKDYKVRVNPKQSEEIQKLCFKLGVPWTHAEDFEVRETERDFLLITSLPEKKGHYICYEETEEFYLGQPEEEITAKKLIKKLKKKVKK